MAAPDPNDTSDINARRITLYTDTIEDRDAIRLVAFQEHKSVSTVAKELMMEGLRARQEKAA